MKILRMKKRELVEMTPKLLNELYRRTNSFEPFSVCVSGGDCDISFYDGSEILSIYSFDDRFEVCSEEVFQQYKNEVLNTICKEILNIPNEDKFVIAYTDEDEHNLFIVYETEEQSFQCSLVNDNVLDHNIYDQIVLLHKNVHEFIGKRWLICGGINVND